MLFFFEKINAPASMIKRRSQGPTSMNNIMMKSESRLMPDCHTMDEGVGATHKWNV
jgi:hypothetical protein